MANILYANNAAGTLASGITNASTTLTLTAAPTAFPSPTPPQVFYVTLTDAATQTLIEIVQVTAVSGNIFSIARAQDGTSALSWNAGDIVSLRTIALELRGFENAAEGIFTGVTITPSSTLGITGTITSDNANTGKIGEYLTGAAGGVAVTSGVPVNAGSVALTAGDWDVSGTCLFNPSAVMSLYLAGVSTTSGTRNTAIGNENVNTITTGAATQQIISTPVVRLSLSSPATAFLVIEAVFTGVLAVQGFIRARRVR